MLTYGGTGFPFGQTSSNKLFVYNIETNEWKRIETENSDQNDCPTERYGQALAIDQFNDLYIVGGTDGYHYSIDVHKFDVITRHWRQLYHKNNNEIQEFPGERYRHEMVFHDNKLIVFGGGTSYGCFSLEVVCLSSDSNLIYGLTQYSVQ